jgi:glycerol-3-phosphate dehydrogenase
MVSGIALINRGLVELMRLGIALGAKRETFMGLAGMGDLVLTCTDNLSRNRRMGLALAAGKTVEEAQEEIQQVVEGVLAAKAVRRHARPLRRSWGVSSSPNLNRRTANLPSTRLVRLLPSSSGCRPVAIGNPHLSY